MRPRVGAQVMILKNLNVGAGLVIGVRGRVESVTSEGNTFKVALGFLHPQESGDDAGQCGGVPLQSVRVWPGICRSEAEF